MQSLWMRLLVGASLRRTLVRAAVLGLVLSVLLARPFRPMWIRGISMEPTLRDGRLCFANLLRYRASRPARGDLVVIAMPGGRAFYAKRVLGQPGETVAFEAGHLLINGVVHPEPYVRRAGTWDVPPVLLEEDQWFVAGDNRAMPAADQVIGIVPGRHLAGGLW